MKFLRNEKGSTSVLIVVLMIVLTAFGITALTTAFAGYRLTQRSSEFQKVNHQLEGAASIIEYDIYMRMVKAKEESGDDMELFHQLANESIEKYLMLFNAADSLYEVKDLSYEQDRIDDYTLQELRLGTLHYTVAETGGKNISMTLDLLLPEEDDKGSIANYIRVCSKVHWQEGVGDVNEDIFFEDPAFELEENIFGD